MNFIATASERVFVLKWKRNRGNKKTNWLLGVSLKVEWACVLRFKNRHRLKPERRCTTLWSYLPPLYYCCCCCCCCCYPTLVWCGVVWRVVCVEQSENSTLRVFCLAPSFTSPGLAHFPFILRSLCYCFCCPISPPRLQVLPSSNSQLVLPLRRCCLLDWIAWCRWIIIIVIPPPPKKKHHH